MDSKDKDFKEKVKKAKENVNSNKNLIVVGNNIISARHGMTSFQLKLLHFLFLNMKNTDYEREAFIEITVNVLDFHKVLGTATSDYLYSKVYSEMEKLRKTDIYVETELKWEKASIISQTSYNKNEGSFSFVLPPLLQRYLIDLNKNFTYIDIRNIVNLDSSYSIRFFDLCKQYERFDKFQLKVDDIRMMFDLPQAYSLYANIKNKIIKKAHEELKQLSDLYFEYEEVKKNKKVDSVIFYIKKRNSNNPILIDEAVANSIEGSFLNKFKIYNIAEKTIDKWINEYSKERVILAYDYLQKQLKKGTNIPNVAGYLHKMISTDFLEKNENAIVEKTKQVKESIENKNKEKSEKEIREKKLIEIESYFYQKEIELVKTLLFNSQDLHILVIENMSKSMIGGIALDNYKKMAENNFLTKQVFIDYLENDKGSFYVSTISFIEDTLQNSEMLDLRKSYKQELSKLGVNS